MRGGGSGLGDLDPSNPNGSGGTRDAGCHRSAYSQTCARGSTERHRSRITATCATRRANGAYTSVDGAKTSVYAASTRVNSAFTREDAAERRMHAAGTKALAPFIRVDAGFAGCGERRSRSARHWT
jgi:hypothetical protein